MFGCFGGVRDPISGRVAGSDGQTMVNLEVRELLNVHFYALFAPTYVIYLDFNLQFFS